MTKTLDWHGREAMRALGPLAWAVLSYLIFRSNMQNRAWPTNEKIHDETDVGSTKVSQSLKKLAEMGAIVKVPHSCRLAEEKHLHGSKRVHQLTGIVKVGDGYIPYQYLSPEEFDAIWHNLAEIQTTLKQEAEKANKPYSNNSLGELLNIRHVNIHQVNAKVLKESLEDSKREDAPARARVQPASLADKIRRQEIKDALADCFGYTKDWKSATAQERIRLGSAATQIFEIGGTAETARNAYDYCVEKEFDAFTPLALAGHYRAAQEWAETKEQNEQPAIITGNAPPTTSLPDNLPRSPRQPLYLRPPKPEVASNDG